MDINELRGQIDEIDNSMSSLFARRVEIAGQIAAYKKENTLPVLDRTRESEILARVTGQENPELAVYIRSLFSDIFDLSRSYQVMLTSGEDGLTKLISEALENSPRKLPSSAQVACQGIQGAYSQIACDKLFAGADIMYMDSFEGVAKAVKSGLCRYGVLPIENNIYGPVNQVRDLMNKHQLYIVRTIKLRVNHNFAVLPGVKDGDIKEVFSHEQAIGQCGEFLKKYPGAKVTVCSNTAVAARHVASSGRSDAAAICSQECCELYGLESLHRDIQNSDNNYTRFICISRDLEIFQGADRISIMFSVPHNPGSLYRVLARFASAGMNVSKLESRPIPGHDFEFMFYADIDADCRDEKTVKILRGLEGCTEQMLFLGAFSEM